MPLTYKQIYNISVIINGIKEYASGCQRCRYADWEKRECLVGAEQPGYHKPDGGPPLNWAHGCPSWTISNQEIKDHGCDTIIP